MTSKVGTASTLGGIEHTDDLIAAVKSGRISLGNIPPELDSPAVRALVEAIRSNPEGPYVALISPGKEAKFEVLPGAGRCRNCKVSITLFFVTIGKKAGWLAIEHGQATIESPMMTMADFLPPRFDPKYTFGVQGSRSRYN